MIFLIDLIVDLAAQQPDTDHTWLTWGAITASKAFAPTIYWACVCVVKHKGDSSSHQACTLAVFCFRVDITGQIAVLDNLKIARMDVEDAADWNEVEHVGHHHHADYLPVVILDVVENLIGLMSQDYVIYQAQYVATVEYEQDSDQDPLLQSESTYVICHWFRLWKVVKYDRDRDSEQANDSDLQYGYVVTEPWCYVGHSVPEVVLLLPDGEDDDYANRKARCEDHYDIAAKLHQPDRVDSLFAIKKLEAEADAIDKLNVYPGLLAT